MANPNLNSATNVYASSAQLSLSTTSATQLVSNAASSGKVFLIDGIVVANTDMANAVVVTVTIFKSATNNGTPYEIASTVAVPANASLYVVTKDAGVSLNENQSIYVNAGTASKLKVSAFWKELS
jgi:hypothetical protein